VIGHHDSVVVRVIGSLFVPFVLVFGVYVIAHGHYGPGGGFAGGVTLTVGVALLRITVGEEESYRRFPLLVGPVAMLVGMLLFVALGLVPMLGGGAFLDYAQLPGGLDPSRLRYLGILVAEVAIGLAVFGALLWIFDSLVGRRL
jgi:multicomponent Na+:H+ antiporter subunit B